MTAGFIGRRGLPGVAYPEQSLARLALELADEFGGIFGAGTVERYLREQHTALLRTSTVAMHLVSCTSARASRSSRTTGPPPPPERRGRWRAG